jgi:hypothetical protein
MNYLVQRVGVCFVFGALSGACVAQRPAPHEQAMVRTESVLLLPDSPGYTRTLAPSSSATSLMDEPEQTVGPSTSQIAKKYARTIQPGQAAQPWGAKEKFIAAFQKQASVGGVFSAAFTAGWGQLRDDRPHYGTDSGAYGERVGAAYIRQSTQSFMTIGVISTLLHEDPRYYVLGPTHSFKDRVVYAATRVVVTRKDDGSSVPNVPLWVGAFSSQAIANAFYPDQDRSWKHTATGTLGSLAGRVATQQLKEFGGDIRNKLRRKKNP